MAQRIQGTLSVFSGEDAAKEQAADLRLYNESLAEDETPSPTDAIGAATVSAVAASINAIVGVSSLLIDSTQPNRPGAQPEAEDEVTILLRNNSGLSVVPVRNEKARGSASVTTHGGAIGTGERTQLKAKTTGLAGSALSLALLIDDVDQHSIVELTLDKVAGSGDNRGWQFSAIRLLDEAEVGLPATGNREVVGVTFDSTAGDLEYVLYLRGCESTSGQISIDLFDRTEREMGLDGFEDDALTATLGQPVRIVSDIKGTSNRKRYLGTNGRDKAPRVEATNSPSDKHLWRLSLRKNGTVWLRNEATGQYITRSTSTGKLIMRGSGSGREWRLNTNDDASQAFVLQAAGHGQFLYVGGGNTATASLSRPRFASGWTLQLVERDETTPAQQIRLRSKVEAANGARLFAQEFDDTPNVRIHLREAAEERQLWTVTFQPNGYVQIQNVGTQNYLANFSNRDLVVVESIVPSGEWRIRTNNGLQAFALQSTNGGNINLVDNQPGGTGGTRDNVNVAPPTATDRQQWTVIES